MTFDKNGDVQKPIGLKTITNRKFVLQKINWYQSL